ncbi:FAD-dependent oxidoreductase [Streptomyces sp. NPDC059340]|uniref:FAD-dependent oxidoreductase n=1 Tax=Streptomyces sp. NPDC059340 TaxID=3346806 RepID=UPI00368B7047
MMENTDVVVIGGGYAGVMAANRLTQRDDVTVTLINPRRTFVERIRLHQLVGGSDDAVVDYRKVLGERVRLVVDTVTRIDAAGRSVTLAIGATVGYGYLVYAVGSGSADPQVPGAAEFAYPIAGLEEAQRLRTVVDAAPATAAVTVVGVGATGIETAAELAEEGQVVLVSDGGGVKQAALRPISGAEKVVRFIVGGTGKAEGTLTIDPTVVNGNPALVLRLDGEVDGIMAIRVEDARITGLYYVRNPEKLTRVAAETPLTLR